MGNCDNHGKHWKTLDRIQKEKEAELSGKAEMSLPQFLAACEACMAKSWPTPGLKEIHFDSSWVSAEGVIISASTIPHCRIKSHIKATV